MKVLRIDSSGRRAASVSRKLTAEIAARFSAAGAEIVTRDVADGLPAVDEAWIKANFTPPEARTAEDKARLALSDELIAELRDADVVVIGAPIYNFAIPAALKAWIDLVCRAGVTFRYTNEGPEGLLTGKRAILAVTSGGVPVGSEFDHATGYLRHVLGFIGIRDVEIVAADRLATDAEASLKAANEAIARIAA
ncbi:MAG: FMN-dependent NADH-azoreductase [Alphaproteobacteria bacterium]|nr:MAG: FMN-dependent NADH-azoreductase [Alphaproteobacteria bacterium]